MSKMSAFGLVLGGLIWGGTGCFGATESPRATALCQFSKSPGGLSQAVCLLPNCPTGEDCSAPNIVTAASDMQFQQPQLQWKDSCPSSAIIGGCWEVYVDFILKMTASDPAGLSEIGVTVAQDVDGKRILRKYAQPAVKPLPDGRYEINGGMVLHVPAGRQLQLSVSELCAKDQRGNEGCSPIRGELKSISSREFKAP